MKTRTLGSTGIQIAPLVFGGNVFGWTADEATSFKLLDAFVGAGFNTIDTADIYGAWLGKAGISETILGKWMKARGNRGKVIVATKVGHEFAPDKKGLKPDYMLRAVEDSLKRLQTDYIDLYQSHRDDPETPQEDTLGAYGRMIEQGKVRAIGASQTSGVRLRQAQELALKHGLPAYQTLQPEYNLYDRQRFEQELLPVCREYGLGVITYYSLASGFLSGKYRSEADYGKSVRGGRMKQYLNERGQRILGALDEVAAEYRATPATVALAWLIGRPGVTAPIASATSVEQLQALTAAAELELSAAALEKLTQAGNQGAGD